MRDLTITSERLAIGLAFIALATLACFAPAQGDTWWLLRAGLDIWSTGSVPLVDTYSHTAAGRYWPNHEWLTEASFYALYRLGGLPVLAAACAAAATAAWGLAYSLTRGSFEARFVALIGCSLPAAMSFALRPQMLTMLFFSVTCALLVRNRLTWVPVVILVWANFHGAVALGLVATAAAGAAAILLARSSIWSVMGLGLACAAATLVTPMGSDLWTFWLESPARSDVNDLIEWQPPGFTPILWTFWAAAAVLIVVTIRNRRHLDAETWRAVAIAWGTLPLALQAVRNVPIFLLAALPALTCAISARATPRPQRVLLENTRLNAAFLGSTALAATVAVAVAWTRPPSALGWHPIPAEAQGAASACEGPMFNTYEDGGALMWFLPGRPVFIDNRQDPYPMDLLADARRAELGGEFQALFARHAIRCAVLPADSPVAIGLEGDPAWARRYADARWRVFERLDR